MRLIFHPCRHATSIVERFVPSLGLGLSTLAFGIIGTSTIAYSLPVSMQIAQATTGRAQSPTLQTLLFVDSQNGNDTTGNGYQGTPFRSITRALQAAPASGNTTILLAPGTYSTASGETFPIQLKAGVTIQGDPNTKGQGILIQGGGATANGESFAFVGATNATLTGVTVTNPSGSGLWAESSNPAVHNNTFTGNAKNGVAIGGNSLASIHFNQFTQNKGSGILVVGDAQPEIRENRFEQTGQGLSIGQNASPLVISNHFSQNRVGVVVQENARPVLRSNQIEGSREDGLTVQAQAQPDLGTAAEPGQNRFRDNRKYDVNAKGTMTVPAAGNDLSPNRVAGRVDLNGTVATTSPVSSQAAPTRANQTASVSASSSRSSEGRNPRPVPTSPTTRRAVSPAVASASNVLITQFPPHNRPPAAALRPTPAAIQIPVPPPETQGSLEQNSEAIEIPVPPPDSLRFQPIAPVVSVAPAIPAAATPIVPTTMAVVPVQASVSLPRQSMIASSQAVSPINQGIQLPAPPPVSIAAAPVEISNASTSASPILQAELLPVPDGDVPIGDTGDMPRVEPLANGGFNADSAVYSEASRASLKYRVVVEARSERLQARVRSIMPNAFPISDRGRPLMQVGAFSSRENAEDAVRMLNQNGFRALIQPLE